MPPKRILGTQFDYKNVVGIFNFGNVMGRALKWDKKVVPSDWKEQCKDDDCPPCCYTPWQCLWSNEWNIIISATTVAVTFYHAMTVQYDYEETGSDHCFMVDARETGYLKCKGGDNKPYDWEEGGTATCGNFNALYAGLTQLLVTIFAMLFMLYMFVCNLTSMFAGRLFSPQIQTWRDALTTAERTKRENATRGRYRMGRVTFQVGKPPTTMYLFAFATFTCGLSLVVSAYLQWDIMDDIHTEYDGTCGSQVHVRRSDCTDGFEAGECSKKEKDLTFVTFIFACIFFVYQLLYANPLFDQVWLCKHSKYRGKQRQVVDLRKYEMELTHKRRLKGQQKRIKEGTVLLSDQKPVEKNLPTAAPVASAPPAREMIVAPGRRALRGSSWTRMNIT